MHCELCTFYRVVSWSFLLSSFLLLRTWNPRNFSEQLHVLILYKFHFLFEKRSHIFVCVWRKIWIHTLCGLLFPPIGLFTTKKSFIHICSTMDADTKKLQHDSNFISSSLAHVQEYWRRTSAKIGQSSKRSQSMPPIMPKDKESPGFGSAFRRNPQTIRRKKKGAHNRSTIIKQRRLSATAHRIKS